MKVTLLQVDSSDTELPAERVERVIRELSTLPASQLYVLPELWYPGFLSTQNWASTTLTRDSTLLERISHIAQDKDAYVHAGTFPMRGGDGRITNQALLFEPGGDIIHSYDKIHTFGIESTETQYFQPGNATAVVQTPWGRLSTVVCYDIRFPAIWETAVEGGAELIVVPAAWPEVRSKHWRALIRARAIENQVYIFACNSVGLQSGTSMGGRSAIISPQGEVLVELGVAEATATVKIFPKAVQRYRQEFPVLRDRKPIQTAISGG